MKPAALFLLTSTFLLTLYHFSLTRGGRFDELLRPSHPNAVCLNKSQLDFGSSGCEHYLDTDMIYHVPGVRIPDLTGDGFELWRTLITGNTMTSFANQACRVASSRYLCPVFFRPCVKVLSPFADPNNFTREQVAVVGTYPCRYLCQEHIEPCRGSVHEEFLDCEVPDPHFFDRPAFDIFPKGPNVTVQAVAPNNDTWTVQFQCYDACRDVAYFGSFDCPQGMHRTGSDKCSFDCPEPLLDKSQFNSLVHMMCAVSWISMVLMAFLLISYLLDPTKRWYPNHLPMFFFASVMCFSFAFCFVTILGKEPEELLCKSTKEPNYFGDGACTVQGILIMYFFMAAVLWWLVICFNIFLMMIFAAKGTELKKGRQTLLLQVAYHSFAWLLPLLPVIIGLAAKRIGSNGSDLWCTIHSSDVDNALTFIIRNGGRIETEGETANVWRFALFWMPLVLCLLVGITFILVVIVFQLKQELGVRGFLTFVKAQWRIFAFLGLYIWVCVFLFAFLLDFTGKRNAQYEEYEEYIECLLQKTSPSEYYMQEHSTSKELSSRRCELDSMISYPLWVLAAFNFAGQGLFVFLIFGSSPSVYLVWWRLFNHARNARWWPFRRLTDKTGPDPPVPTTVGTTSGR
ncbi:hypothetical protein QOT17_011387 [Balamuthia mandrillaris]